MMKFNVDVKTVAVSLALAWLFHVSVSWIEDNVSFGPEPARITYESYGDG